MHVELLLRGSKFNSRVGNTVTLVEENNRPHRLNSTSHDMIDMVFCLVSCVIDFFLIDIVNKVQA